MRAENNKIKSEDRSCEMNSISNRRDFIKAAGFAVASLALPGCGGTSKLSQSDAGAKKPNIIFIMADDMGYGDLGCYNKNSKIPTPNMDALAAGGIRFTDAHSPSAVCTPTRYGVITGRYCWRSRLKRGVLNGYSPALIDTQRMTVASLLKGQGYATACIGKWHLGLGSDKRTDFSKTLVPGPNDLGFDYFYGIPASLDMTPYCYVENDRAVDEPTLTIEAGKSNEDGWWRKGAIAPGFKHVEVLPNLTKKAVDYIGGHAIKSPDKPFFMYFPLPAPHCPIAPADFVRGRSGAGGYGDYVVEVDWTVGQVVKALQRNGLAENTLIIVTSDNGSPGRTKIDRAHSSVVEHYGHNPSGNLRGIKADVWDGGHREPFVACWPGKIPAGRVCSEICGTIDLLPTFARLAGAEMPADRVIDGRDIRPLMEGRPGAASPHGAYFYYRGRNLEAVRSGKWKLRRVKKKTELYDLEADISEKENLADRHPEIVKRLAGMMEEFDNELKANSRPSGKSE